jgi:hypothetical protein
MFYEANNKKDFIIGWIMGAITVIFFVIMLRIMS